MSKYHRQLLKEIGFVHRKEWKLLTPDELADRLELNRGSVLNACRALVAGKHLRWVREKGKVMVALPEGAQPRTRPLRSIA